MHAKITSSTMAGRFQYELILLIDSYKYFPAIKLIKNCNIYGIPYGWCGGAYSSTSWPKSGVLENQEKKEETNPEIN